MEEESGGGGSRGGGGGNRLRLFIVLGVLILIAILMIAGLVVLVVRINVAQTSAKFSARQHHDDQLLASVEERRRRRRRERRVVISAFRPMTTIPRSPPPKHRDLIIMPPPPPRYDHVLLVIFENHGYDAILGPERKHLAPYIHTILLPQSANMTASFGLEHGSQGNYMWLFSGSNQNVGFYDQKPKEILYTDNLALALINKNYTFAGYAEDQPGIDTKVWRDGSFVRRHVPWASWGNLPPNVGLRFPQDFPSDDYSKLPTVSFIIPNKYNIMHSGDKTQQQQQQHDGGGGTAAAPPTRVSKITTGDAWLAKNIDPYLQWATKNNSLLIVTFDESKRSVGYRHGLTDPGNPDRRNRIATLLAGAHIKPGNYAQGKGITHVNVLRTIEAMYGLPKLGAQQEHAARYGITDDHITGCFVTAEEAGEEK